jgi:hypothetical protein
MLARIIAILVEHRVVQSALTRPVIDSLSDFQRKAEPTLAERAQALRTVVEVLDLDEILVDVSSWPEYFAALVGLCYETAAVSGRGLLVKELYATRHYFYFSVPAGAEISMERTRVPGVENSGYGFYDEEGKLQRFLAIDLSDGGFIDFDRLECAVQDESNEFFRRWLRGQRVTFRELAYVTGGDPQSCEYRSADFLSDDDTMTIDLSRRVDTRRKLKGCLIDALDQKGV